MAALYKKRKFKVFRRSDPKKRIRNRMYYRRNKARIKAKRRLWRLRNRAHRRLQNQMGTVMPLWYRHKGPAKLAPGRAAVPVRAPSRSAPRAHKLRLPRISRGITRSS